MRAAVETDAESTTVPVADRDTGARGNVEIRVATEPTGERRTIQGLDARRAFLTGTLEGEVMVPQEEGGTDRMEEAGTIVLLTDLWLAEPFPEMAALAEAQREHTIAARGSGAAMGQLMASNPDLEQAMEEQARELAGLEGMAVESYDYLVVVPPGQEFDRDKTLAFATRSLGSQVSRSVAGAAAQEAMAAAGRVAGRLGGVLGRSRQEEPEEAEKLEQSVQFRVRSRLTEMARAQISEAHFEMPAGYTEKPIETVGRN